MLNPDVPYNVGSSYKLHRHALYVGQLGNQGADLSEI